MFRDNASQGERATTMAAERFQVRTTYKNGTGYEVWDTQTDSVAYRRELKDGELVPAVYTSGNDTKKWAHARCNALNKFGYTDDIKARMSGATVIDKVIGRIAESEGIDNHKDIDLDQFLPQIENEIRSRVDHVAADIKKKIADDHKTLLNDAAQKAEQITARVDAEVSTILELVEETKTMIKATQKIEVVTERGSKILDGLQHFKFPTILKMVSAGVLPMLVGPAASGKTTIAEQIASALDLPFYAQSVGSQTTMSHLMGFLDGHGVYRDTAFRKAYEGGGIFLLDEMDAGNANVLVSLNAALAGNWCSFPDGMVKRHQDFVCIAAANTFGQGANRVYMGRNQLDAATLDRFAIIEFPVDEDLEGSIVSVFAHGKRWHNAVKRVRTHANAHTWHVVISPRATIKGARLLDVGLSLNEVIEMTLFNGATTDQRNTIVDLATKGYNGQ